MSTGILLAKNNAHQFHWQTTLISLWINFIDNRMGLVSGFQESLNRLRNQILLVQQYIKIHQRQ